MNLKHKYLMKLIGCGVKMEKMVILALKAKQHKEYQTISKELSETTSNHETTLTNNLNTFFNKLTDQVIQYITDEKITTSQMIQLQTQIKQIYNDNLENYKIILGKQVIKTYDNIDTITQKQIRQQEKQIITDAVTNNTIYNNQLSYNKEVNTSTENNMAQKRIIENRALITPIKSLLGKKTVQSTLDSFIKKTGKIQSTIDDYIYKPLEKNITQIANSLVSSFKESIMDGVLESVNTPEKLFDIIPNEKVMDFFENRLFVASEKTMNRVSDNIYNIISKESQQEGKHPYEIARTLKQEFNQLNTMESKRIARTEVLRARHQTQYDRYLANETVEFVRWDVTVIDDNSREEHVEQADLITYLGNPFPNGQRYPYDENSEPGDYINCRCGLEAFYPDPFYVPPANAEWWYADEMQMMNNPPLDSLAGQIMGYL